MGRALNVDVGHVVAGKYELVRRVGRGSMGEVWAADHRTLGEQVALKLLTPVDAIEDGEEPGTAAARFLFEAQVAARLSRKTRHIVRVTDHGEEGGLAYLVMELLEGETLEQVLARDGRVAIATVATIVRQVSRALQQAHNEGVFHRDLKPANVFLTRDEEGNPLVKLLDFGIARTTHAHRTNSGFSTARGLVFGTPSYMSPEQARASRKLDHRCDLWALSTVAYEGITGELPVRGEDTEARLMNLCAGHIMPLRERRPDLPESLDAFFTKAFARRVDLRYQSATELASAFHSALGSPSPSEEGRPRQDVGGGSTRTTDPSFDARTPKTHGRTIGIAVAGIVACFAIAAGWRALVGSQTQPVPEPAAPVVQSPIPPPSIPPAQLTTPTLADPSPAVPVSVLSRATSSAPIASSRRAQPTTVPSTSAAPAAPVPAPAAPSADPAATPTHKVDRSELL